MILVFAMPDVSRPVKNNGGIQRRDILNTLGMYRKRALKSMEGENYVRIRSKWQVKLKESNQSWQEF